MNSVCMIRMVWVQTQMSTENGQCRDLAKWKHENTHHSSTCPDKTVWPTWITSHSSDIHPIVVVVAVVVVSSDSRLRVQVKTYIHKTFGGEISVVVWTLLWRQT